MQTIIVLGGTLFWQPKYIAKSVSILQVPSGEKGLFATFYMMCWAHYGLMICMASDQTHFALITVNRIYDNPYVDY